MRNIALVLVTALLAGCSYPNITLKMPPQAAIPVEQVQVVDTMPADARIMAQVFAWSSVPVDSRVGYERAVAQLRERAASIGARTVWVPSFKLVTTPAGSRWVDPDPGRDRDGGFVRPTEMTGLALATH